MKKILFSCQIAIYLAILICVVAGSSKKAKDGSILTADLANSVNEFALKLYSRTTNKTQNYFISPYSVWMALSMCYAGSGGSTKTELNQLLAYGKKNDTEIFKQVEQHLNNFVGLRNASYSLNLANRIFPKKNNFSLNQNYANLVKKYFKAGVQPLDFKSPKEAANVVNKWVSDNTANKINNILSPDLINEYTRMILANAIYFKAFWLYRFNKDNTIKQDFSLANGNKTKVNMMRIERKLFRCLTNLSDLDASLCELPYEGEKIAMTIILPNKNSSLSKLEQKLDINKLRNVLNSQKSLTPVNVYLPKFKLEYKSEMSNDLISLGAKLSFSDKANFSGISTNEPLKISKVVHQTFLDVNEDGTEAAAATIVTIETTSLILNPQQFICDRPFMFLIHDTTSKAILFIGKFVSP